MKKFVVSVLAALLAFAGFTPQAQADEFPVQWRSWWVDSFNQGLRTPSEVSRLVADAKAANVNALVVQAVRRFDCLCNNSNFPRAQVPGLAAAPFDPLAEVIRQGRAAGLEVHAWVNIATFWNAAATAEAGHAFRSHGPSASGANSWVNKAHDGSDRAGNSYYVDLANPAAVNYLVDGIASILRNYSVDGINLDYVRYPDNRSGGRGNEWGYSETSLQRFRADTGRADKPAPADAQFSQWRRDQVTNTVQRIRNAIDSVRPAADLSVNGTAYGHGPSATRSWQSADPYATVMQDWYGWARSGLIDMVVLMNYKNEANASHAAMFASWNQFLVRVKNETGRHMVSGPGLYLNTIPNSVRQTQVVTSLGLGWSGYSYANVSQAATASNSLATKTQQRNELTNSLKASVFTRPATIPGSPWKNAQDLYTTPGHHHVNGREWRTSCEPYSQTTRCRTEILGTKVTYSGGRYVSTNGWVFNNLTYLPLMTQAQWGSNPLARNGTFTSNGRQWRTECNNQATGQGACRSYIYSPNTIQARQNANGSWSYYHANVWVFNNMVLFKK